MSAELKIFEEGNKVHQPNKTCIKMQSGIKFCFSVFSRGRLEALNKVVYFFRTVFSNCSC